MANFNIQNSKIEQLSDTGNNYKVTNVSGDVSISEQGNIVKTDGTSNTVQVNQKSSFWAMLGSKLKSLWNLIFGTVSE